MGYEKNRRILLVVSVDYQGFSISCLVPKLVYKLVQDFQEASANPTPLLSIANPKERCCYQLNHSEGILAVRHCKDQLTIFLRTKI